MPESTKQQQLAITLLNNLIANIEVNSELPVQKSDLVLIHKLLTDAGAAKNTMQLPLRAVPMNLFPTLGSLQQVVDLGESKLPIISRNELSSLLFTYHNTLLSQLSQCSR